MKLKDVRMNGFKRRMSLSDALDVLDSFVKVSKSEIVNVDSAVGRVLSNDVVSPCDVPYFRRSAMDGYAVVSCDTYGASQYNPVSFKVAGEVLAGGEGCRMGKGECVRIMTGGQVPSGADAVVMVEYCRENDDEVLVHRPVAEFENVSAVGEDVGKGSIVYTSGRVLRAYDAGVLASLGINQVSVYAMPRVDVIVTGSELVDVSGDARQGKIIDSNSHLLRGLVADGGAIISSIKRVGDDYDLIKKEILGCEGDIIIVTGGTSCGKEDFAPLVVDEVGELLVHGVAVRPAGPVGFGVVFGKTVFLLPGNPLAVCVAFDFFVRHAIGLMTDTGERKVTVKGALVRKVASAAGRTDIFRVRYAEGTVEPIRAGGGAILSSLVRANGYLVVPDNIEGYDSGEMVDVRLF